MRNRNVTLQLLVVAVLSAATYLLAFVRPLGLLEWWHRRTASPADLSPDPVRGEISFLLALTLLFALYVLALKTVRGCHGRGVWLVVVGGMALFNGAMVLAYPFTSNDVFEYIIRARILAVYGGNPFYDAPTQFPADPFFPYVYWRELPSAYGPLWELVAAGLSKAAGDGVVANVIAFKLVAVFAGMGTTALIGLMLRSVAPEQALRGVTLFAWNPLVVIETAGNGHNDTVMMFFVVLGFLLLVRGRLTLAVLAMIAGVLVKFIPVLLVPLMVVAGMKRMAGWGARGRYLLATGTAGGLLGAAFYAPFWRGGDVLGVDRRSEMFTSSFPTLVRGALKPLLGEAEAERVVIIAATALLAAWVIHQTDLVRRSHDDLAPVRAGLSIFLFYLLVACPWLMTWYVVWPLALAALLPVGTAIWGTLLFSYGASWKPALGYFSFVLLAGRPELRFIWPELPISAGMVLLPWLYLAYLALKGRLWKPRPGGDAPTG